MPRNKRSFTSKFTPSHNASGLVEQDVLFAVERVTAIRHCSPTSSFPDSDNNSQSSTRNNDIFGVY